MFIQPDPTMSVPLRNVNSGDRPKGSADQLGVIIGIVTGCIVVIAVGVLLHVFRRPGPLTLDEECDPTTEMDCLESSINSGLAQWETTLDITIATGQSALDTTIDETPFFYVS
jgi:hypothetical protein